MSDQPTSSPPVAVLARAQAGAVDDRRARRLFPLAAALGGLLTLVTGGSGSSAFPIAMALLVALAGLLAAMAFFLTRATVARRAPRRRAAARIAPPLVALVIGGSLLGTVGALLTARTREATNLAEISATVLPDVNRALNAPARVPDADAPRATDPLDAALLRSLVPESLRADAAFMATLERDSSVARQRCARKEATAGKPRSEEDAMNRMGCLVREMRREYPLRTPSDSARDDIRSNVLIAYRDSIEAREARSYGPAAQGAHTP